MTVPGEECPRAGSPSHRTMKDTVTGKPLLEASDQKLVDGVLARQPRALAKAITLVESTRRDHQARAERAARGALAARPAGRSAWGSAARPASGKSTFIEALGLHLIGQGHRVAVLAVDPSSSISGGSILGDKTRMERLSPGAERVHPPVALARLARRGGGEDPRGDARLRGGRLRRDPGRDRGGGPVGDDRGRHGRRLRAAPAAQRRRRPAGDQEGDRRAGRHHRHQQGRHRSQGRGAGEAPVRRGAVDAPQRLAQLASAGGHA